jgi:hypothetical protein
MQGMPVQRRAAGVIAAALIVVFLIALSRLNGMPPKPANAPANEFSAVRALAAERATIGGRVPHPTGSAEARAVRDRLVKHLDALGYETTVKRSFACDDHNDCATVENILAHPPAQPAGAPVILTAHYDSVFAGPGASDDGAGVATVLEIARIIRTEKFRSPIMLLIDDGEEAGLLGAEAFAADQTAIDRDAAFVNLEARGTGGSSYLFETSPNNRWFVPTVAKKLPRPITTSLFFSIYELLPNDTDLTVYKRAGLTGVNFAFIKNVGFYHSPFDDIDHVDLRTLQHHGENALAAVRALANLDLHRRSTGNAIWFDVLGFFVLWWPARWTIMLVIAALVLSIVAASILVREDEASWREIAIGIATFLAAIIGAALVAAAIAMILPSAKWLAFPYGAIVSTWLIGTLVTLAVIAFARRRARFDSLFIAGAIAWNLLALVVTFLLTGASYGFLVPGIVLAITATLRATGNGGELAVSLVAALVAAILWFPFGITLYDALGKTSLPVIALLIALVTTTFAPLFDRLSRAFVLVVVALCVIGVIVSLALPATTAERPSRVMAYYLDDGEKTQWIASSPVGNVTRAETMFNWYAVPPEMYVAPAPRLALAPVLVTREGNAIRVRSQRNADRVALVIHANVPSLRVNGIAPPPRTARFRNHIAPGWTRVTSHGSEMVVDVGSAGPVEVYASDLSSGLPPEGAEVAAARRAAHAYATDSGDATITTRHATL